MARKRIFDKKPDATTLHGRLCLMADRFCDDIAAQFAEKIGEKQSTVFDYMRESGEHKVKYLTFLRILEAFPDVNPAWLLVGEGEMLRSDTAQETTAPEPKKPAPAEEPGEKSLFERELAALVRELRAAEATNETIQRAILAKVGAAPGYYPVAGGKSSEVRVSEGPGVQEDPGEYKGGRTK